MMIRLSEYAKMHGKSPRAVISQIEKGNIPAKRSGSRWYIDSNTPYPEDSRIKHGVYVGIRKKLKEQSKE
jgi:hypothetical protein